MHDHIERVGSRNGSLIHRSEFTWNMGQPFSLAENEEYGRKRKAEEDVGEDLGCGDIVIWQLSSLLDKSLLLVQKIVRLYTLLLPDVLLRFGIRLPFPSVLFLVPRSRTTFSDVWIRSSIQVYCLSGFFLGHRRTETKQSK